MMLVVIPILPEMTQEAYAGNDLASPTSNEFKAANSLTVQTGEDSTAPVLNGFKVVNSSVTRPGVVQIQLNITEEDSGFSDFEIALDWTKGDSPQNGSISTGLEYGGASGDTRREVFAG